MIIVTKLKNIIACNCALFVFFAFAGCTEDFSVTPTPIQQNGLVAFYPFNGTAIDESGNTNDGAIHNNPKLTQDRFDRNEKAFIFNGIDTYIAVKNDESINFTDSLSFSTWIFFSEAPISAGHILNKSARPGNYEYGLYIYNNDSLCFGAIAGGSNAKEIYSTRINPNRWYNITVTWQHPGMFKLYLDGQLQDSRFTSAAIDGENGSLVFGRNRAENSNDCFKGIIDDTRIYNRILTKQEIQSIFHEGGW